MEWRKTKYFGGKSKSCINEHINFTNGTYQPFSQEFSYLLWPQPINPSDVMGPTAYSRLMLRFLWKLVPSSICADRNAVVDADGLEARVQSEVRCSQCWAGKLSK